VLSGGASRAQGLALAAILLGVAAGLAAGLGGYTFVYAKGYSYLTNDPAACANCHVMDEYYSGWIKSSHRSVATCNDCHTPHSLVPKYATKAKNGFWHSFYFTTGRFPEPLRITPGNREIAQRSCRKCHQDMVQVMDAPHGSARRSDCILCHGAVGHPRR
jgi:cytochrome c nitrite reductase small subunit